MEDSALQDVRLVPAVEGSGEPMTARTHTFGLLIVLLAELALVVYLATGRLLASGDTLPARYLPVALLEAHTFTLDGALAGFAGVPPGPDGVTPYSLRRVHGHYLSWYPIGAPVLAVPIYAAAGALGADLRDEATLRTLEKGSAALMVAASVAILGWALGALLPAEPTWAVTLTLLYAFGTSSLSTSSQALWQHGPSQLALAATFALLACPGPEVPRLLGAGFAAGVAAITRPSDVILLGPILAALAVPAPRRLLWLGLGALPPLTLEVAYRWTYFGTPLALFYQSADLGLGYFTGTWLAGVAGILVSPARGLLVWSPFVALSPWGFTRRDAPGWVRAAGVGAILTVAAYGLTRTWWAGHSIGPRLLADLTPALVLGLAPIRDSRARAAVVLLGAAAIVAHASGAFLVSPLYWNVWRLERDPLNALWEWGHSPLACAARELLRGLEAAERACGP